MLNPKRADRSFVLLKILKYTGTSLVGIVILMFLTPYLFPTLVTEQVKKWANNHIEGELNFSKVNLSFFNHFPALTFTLYDFSLKGSKPFESDTLVSSNEIALGIDLPSLIFEKKVTINKIFLTNAFMNVQVNEKGAANYNVYSSKSNSPTDTAQSDGGLKIDLIEIDNSHLIYNDRSIPLIINAKGFNYKGKGDLSEAIFQLKTKATIDSLDFYFNNEPYVLHKSIEARLITSINTNSLAFIFERNRLKINQLPLEFTGKFNFLDNGYDMDFNVVTKNTALYNLITALPPAYTTWLEKTRVEGVTDIAVSLKGQYTVSDNKKPDLSFAWKVSKGLIAYNNAAAPASDILLDLDVKIPSLNMDSLLVKMDSLSLKIDQNFLHANLFTTGVANPAIDIKSDIRAHIDLARLDETLGFTGIDIRGLCKLNAKINGRYIKGNGLLPKAVPIAILDASLIDGSIKTDWYPQPISNIQLKANVSDRTGTLKDLLVNMETASFDFEGTPFLLTASFKEFNDIAYAINLKGELDFNRIYKVFSQEGLNVKGYAKADLKLHGKQSDAVNGRYNQLHNEGSLQLREIDIHSSYLPKAFEVKEGLFHFKEDKMNFDNFTASYGSSDFRMNGYLQNVINYALSDSGSLKGRFTLNSRLTDLNEFMMGDNVVDTSSVSDSSTGVIRLPPQLDLGIKASISKVKFKELSLSDFVGDLGLNHSKLTLNTATFNMIGAKVAMRGSYEALNSDRASFEYGIKANDFDVQKAYKEIALFREMAPSAATAQGIISLNYQLKGKLNGDMYPVFPSLSGGGVLSVKDVQVKGFKLFNAVSNKTGKSDLRDPSFEKVDLKTTIKNNIITLERVKMKVAGFRPRIEGQTSFDGRVNLKMRLGLPPLGIIGIPIKVTGTQDNPVIKLGRNTEDLEETEDDGAGGNH